MFKMIWDNPLKSLIILRSGDITESMHINVWAQPVLSQCNDTSVPKTLWHYNKSEYKRMSTTSVKTM